VGRRLARKPLIFQLESPETGLARETMASRRAMQVAVRSLSEKPAGAPAALRDTLCTG